MLIYDLKKRRREIYILLGITFGLLILVAVPLAAIEYAITISEGIFMTAAYAIVAVIVFLTIHLTWPKIVMTGQGVTVHKLGRKRFYAWTDIQQAGILYRQPGGRKYNELVLLKPGGSKRGFRDKSFDRRNFGRIIYIEVTDGIRRFVVKHYGPLDFDLSDGRAEGSIVEE